ncbi:hypothetical protein N3K63_14775 [Microbacterium sp. W1N]|uniref:endonuclease domain-containing protein n=1 Tax=Microbacterium festucae TaxID=2977531 RepID=UPI0021BF02EB|nr:hypothetical protein [Microbacterium festucae]MCT9821548.1 hypothetical protein [Microbacterium festucae]
MTRLQPLPTALVDRAFSVREAQALGVTTSRLRGRDLDSPAHGGRVVRRDPPPVPADESPSQRSRRQRDELVAHAQQVAPVLKPSQFFSHETALALLGVPLPYGLETDGPLHVAAHRPSGQPRRAGMIGHRLSARAHPGWMAAGAAVEHPARAWRQVGATWHLDDLIAAADHLVLPRNALTTLDELRAEVALMGDVAGGTLTHALDQVRVGAETAEETRLRLLLVRAGLPEPQLNQVLHTREGRFVARMDLAFPAYRVAVEHDGRTHAFNDAQFARDADRWDEIRAQGWVHVRILSHHLHPDPNIALDKVTTALLGRGWRPGRR